MAIADTTRNEIQALDAGGAAQQRASDSLMQSYQSGQQQATASAGMLASATTQGLELKQGRARDEENARHNKMTEAQTSDQQDIESASRGVERQGNSRADALRSEMDRGNQQLQGQMDKPLEVPGPKENTVGKVVPTEEAQQQKYAQLETQRMRAKAEQQRLKNEFAKAKVSGDKELQARATKSLEQPIVSATDLYNRGRKSAEGSPGGLDDAGWSNIEMMATHNGQQVPDPQLMQDLKSKNFTPRVGQFLQNGVAVKGLEFTAQTGELPSGKLVDFASPAMQHFTAIASGLTSWLSKMDAFSGGLMSKGMKIDSLAKRNEVVNTTAAQLSLRALSNPTPQANPIPSQGGGQQGGAPMAQGQQQTYDQSRPAGGSTPSPGVFPVRGQPGAGQPRSTGTAGPTGDLGDNERWRGVQGY